MNDVIIISEAIWVFVGGILYFKSVGLRKELEKLLENDALGINPDSSLCYFISYASD